MVKIKCVLCLTCNLWCYLCLLLYFAWYCIQSCVQSFFLGYTHDIDHRMTHHISKQKNINMKLRWDNKCWPAISVPAMFSYCLCVLLEYQYEGRKLWLLTHAPWMWVIPSLVIISYQMNPAHIMIWRSSSASLSIPKYESHSLTSSLGAPNWH